MVYTELTKKAMKISYNVHNGQFDKTGIPYIFHPMHLAEQMDDEITICVALLHDVVEDGNITFEDLESYGFTYEIIEAVRLLTHEKSISYMDYISKIKSNPVAKKVKLADLTHNSNLTRLSCVNEKDIERAEKYSKAIALLNNEDLEFS